MPAETTTKAEIFQSTVKQIRRNLNKSLTKKNIVKSFEEDPDADFDSVLHDALESYSCRMANARNKAEHRLLEERLVEFHSISSPTQVVFGHQSPSATVTILSELSSVLQALLKIENIPYEEQPHVLKIHLSELIEKGSCLHSSPTRRVVQLDNFTVVKFGSYAALEEFTMLDYIAEHTTIPVPRSMGCVKVGNTSYLFTTFIPGETLERRWDTLTVAQKASVRYQLNTILTELRNFPYPTNTPLGSLSTPHVCKDYHMTVAVSSPNILTISQFHDFLVSRPLPNVSPFYLRWLRSQLRDEYRIVLSHGDLHPRNILVVDSPEGTVHISAIIDWEMGGWYPEYWEMYKALNTRNGNDSSDWWEHFPEVILGFDREVLERRVVEQSMQP
ncbi:kinase-like domain-containing protein [Abortiporus biennis]|nr:kinase-like domain-containing protein [Abortiporus biennis]